VRKTASAVELSGSKAATPVLLSRRRKNATLGDSGDIVKLIEEWEATAN
jgi:hypothetical protein